MLSVSAGSARRCGSAADGSRPQRTAGSYLTGDQTDPWGAAHTGRATALQRLGGRGAAPVSRQCVFERRTVRGGVCG